MNTLRVLMAGLAVSAFSLPAHAQDSDSGDETVETEDEVFGDDWLLTEETVEQTFGRELLLLGLSTSWSGYGDFVATMEPGESFVFDAYHFNPILGVQITPQLWAEVELELEHGGEEIKVELAFLDYIQSQALGFRVGQILVPIGEFNDTYHPSFRWKQITRPLMFRDVMPAIWSDVGVQLFGRVGSGSTAIRYNLFAINGLGGELDVTADEPFRSLRGNTRDNNFNKGVGARLGLYLLEDASFGKTRIMLSGYQGAVSEDNADTVSIANVAFTSELGKFLLLGEASQTFLEEDGANLTPFQNGAYLQPSVTVKRWTLATRWDYVKRKDQDSRQELSSNVAFNPQIFWSLRAGCTVPLVGDEAFTPRYEAMSAFYF